MLVGCIGGSIYHGLRRWRIFLFMDWVPIALLCLMASIYFWIKLTGKWFYGVLAFVIFLAIEGLSRFLISGTENMQLAISINYSVMVLMILLPLTLLLIKTRWANWQTVAFALASFIIAISFRVYDHLTTLSIGTHFLWHGFGVVATALMFSYLYRLANSTKTES
jgi:hemolysin III